MNPLSSTHEHQRETARKDRVSMREMIGLGLGKAVADGTHGSLYTLINPIFNMTMGLPPQYISIIMFIQRIWDAFIDPVAGQFSDNFRSRWGRRRPLMLIAIFPLALFFGTMWWFPVSAGGLRFLNLPYLFWHLLLISMIFYAAHSLFTMPLSGLIIEATDDYHERTRIAGVTLAFGFAVQIGSQWLFPLTQIRVLESASTAAKASGTVTGVHWVASGCVVAFLVMGLVPVLLCRERLYKTVSSKQRQTSLLEGLRAVADDRSFVSLLAARGIFSFGFQLVGSLGGYLYIYYVYGGDLKAAAVNAAWIGSSFHVAAIISSLLIFPWLEKRVGKRRCLQAAAFVLVLDCVSKIYCYQHNEPWLPIFVVITNGISNAGISLMAVAMAGDIADYDEWKNGVRREGLFMSLISWVEKAGGSVGVLLTGFLLANIGFDALKGAQSGHTLRLMKFSYVLAPMLGAFATLWFIRGYTLTQDQVYEIREALVKKRAGAIPAV